MQKYTMNYQILLEGYKFVNFSQTTTLLFVSTHK